MILTQSTAIFVDAYRELNAKKLFWLTMILTVIFAAAIAILGIDQEGIKVLWFHLSFIPVNSEILEPKAFYLATFSYLGIGIWLTWIATILAIISTAGIIPDLVSGGTIETVLARPISRTRLFLTKYSTGLMFVALQVSVFSVLSMLIIWFRSGYFEPRILLAIPIVVSFFSFLFSVSAFIGLLTRSTMTAMLMTLLFWCFLFLLNLADALLIQFQESTKIYVEQRTMRVELARENTTKLLFRQLDDGNIAIEDFEPSDEELFAANPMLNGLETKLAEDKADQESLKFWTGAIFTTKTLFPKTGETIELLNRQLIDPNEFTPPSEDSVDTLDPYSDIQIDQEELVTRVESKMRERSIAWILGTSFIFEGLLLGLSTLIFTRRDF